MTVFSPERGGKERETEEREKTADCVCGPLHQTSPEDQVSRSMAEVHGGLEEREEEGHPVPHPLEVRTLLQGLLKLIVLQ